MDESASRSMWVTSILFNILVRREKIALNVVACSHADITLQAPLGRDMHDDFLVERARIAEFGISLRWKRGGWRRRDYCDRDSAQSRVARAVGVVNNRPKVTPNNQLKLPPPSWLFPGGARGLPTRDQVVHATFSESVSTPRVRALEQSKRVRVVSMAIRIRRSRSATARRARPRVWPRRRSAV